MELTYTTAFLAGMISFLSPCVLPLVPGFVGTMTGLSAEQLQEDGAWHWRTILFNALLFVLGFSVLFISLGASAGAVGRFLSAHRDWLNRVAGAGIVFFGLVLLGWLPIRFLHRDIRFQREIRQGKFRSFLLGLAFAFGWTPCAGPALVAMLMMAATQNSVWRGTSLLAVYSAGFGIRPFVLRQTGRPCFLSISVQTSHMVKTSNNIDCERDFGLRHLGAAISDGNLLARFAIQPTDTVQKARLRLCGGVHVGFGHWRQRDDLHLDQGSPSGIFARH